MKISIIHPSRGRQEMALSTAKKWVGNSYNPNDIEYLLSVDYDDSSVVDYIHNFSYTGVKFVTGHNSSAIEAINKAAGVSSGDLIVVVSDDFDCPEGWDTLLIEALQGKSDFIVKTIDGIQKTLITLPIMDRAYYNRFGYVYHPSYQHMHSDEEMTMVGFMLGKTITLPIEFKHNHYSIGAMQKDAINKKNDKTYPQGFANLNQRKKINFGLNNDEIVNDYRSIIWH